MKRIKQQLIKEGFIMHILTFSLCFLFHCSVILPSQHENAFASRNIMSSKNDNVLTLNDITLDGALAEEVIANRPPIISFYIKALQNPSKLARAERTLLFIGEPGVGKSTLTQAMAIKTQTFFKFIEATEIGNRYQDSGQETLKKH